MKPLKAQLKRTLMFAWSWFEWTALALFLVTFVIAFVANAEGLADYNLPGWTI